MKRWYVVHTRAQSETLAANHLARQGFQVYLPKYAKRYRHARQSKIVAAPLFPRYLFVSIDTAVDRWRCIQSTIGVSSLVTNGNAPLPVSDVIIGSIRARENQEGLVSLVNAGNLTPGAVVTVIDGPFADQTGIFECLNDNERVTLLLSFLGRKIRVKLPTSNLGTAA